MNKYILILLIFSFSFCFACHTPTDTSKQKNSTETSSVNTTENLHQLATTASKKGEWLKAAQYYEQIYQKAPSNEAINHETGTHYLKANYLHKALSILTGFKQEQQDISAEFNGRIARIAKAHYQLGQYQSVLELVENYDYPKMYRGLAREHLKALIQLKEKEQLSTFLLTYQQSGIYDDKGKSTNMGFLYRAICNELLLVDNLDLLAVYTQKYSAWANQRLAKDKRNTAIAAFYQQDYPIAISKIKTAITSEKSARHQMELNGLLGIAYAQNQEIGKAIAQIQKINAMADLPARHDAFGAKHYHQARIEVTLKQSENALSSLNKALANNAEFWSNRFKEDGLLKGLFGKTEFELLTKFKE